MSHPRSPDALNHLTAEAATSDSRPPNAATRREIRFTHHDDCEAAALVLEHVAAEQVPHLFVRSGQLVRLVSVDERVRIEVLSRDRLTAHLGEHYYLTKIERDKKEQVKQLAGPWPRLVNQLLHRGQWPELPSLRAVSKTPCYSPSWDLMRQRGYHEQAQLFLDLDLLETTTVKREPTPQDVRRARSLIDELLKDFPFDNDSSRTHAISLGLLPFVRSAIRGPTPLHLISAPTPGTGKSLLITALGTIATGESPAAIAEARDDEEWRKRITAMLIEAPPIIALDNLNLKLHSGALSAALTTPVWSDRILGKSETIELPNRSIWIATANNPQLSTEIARRCVLTRLDARCERPHMRASNEFTHPDLIDWINEHRPQLVNAFLTLVQNWLAQGRPRGTQVLGSFSEWAHTVGGILEAAGIEGFLGNLADFYAEADKETNEWRALVDVWAQAHQGFPIHVSALLLLCEEHGLLEAVRGQGNERSQKIKLGRALGKMEGRVYGDWSIRRAMDQHAKASAYRLEQT